MLAAICSASEVRSRLLFPVVELVARSVALTKVRLRAEIKAVDDITGGVQITWGMTWEREGGDKPVCVAESVTRQYV